MVQLCLFVKLQEKSGLFFRLFADCLQDFQAYNAGEKVHLLCVCTWRDRIVFWLFLFVKRCLFFAYYAGDFAFSVVFVRGDPGLFFGCFSS